jgi:hypothetical protein
VNGDVPRRGERTGRHVGVRAKLPPAAGDGPQRAAAEIDGPDDVRAGVGDVEGVAIEGESLRRDEPLCRGRRVAADDALDAEAMAAIGERADEDAGTTGIGDGHALALNRDLPRIAQGQRVLRR